MSDIRQTIEAGFGGWAHVVVRWRWALVAITLVVTSLLAMRIPQLEIETSSEDYLFDSDPAKIAYDAFRSQFGRDQPLMVLVEPPEVFDLDFLDSLRRLHEDIEENVLYLDEVTSLVNVRSVRGEGSELIVDDLLAEMPATEADLESLREWIRSTPSYWDFMISRDERIVVLLVKPFVYSTIAIEAGELEGFEEGDSARRLEYLTARENSAFCQSVLDVIGRHQRPGTTLHLTGQPLIAFALTVAMREDVPRIFGGALSLIAVLIVILFRRLSPFLLAASVVILSILSTFGIGELIKIPVSLPTQVLPSFMLAVGVGYAVHLIAIFLRALAESGHREGAIEVALRQVGLPLIMSALTTAAGLISFVAGEMEQVAHLGIMGAIGVAVTLVNVLVFLPAMLAILRARSGQRVAGIEGGDAFLAACARLSTHHPRKLVAGVIVLAIGSIALLPALDYSADPIRYFPEGHWLRSSTEYADARLGGMQSLEIVLDTGRENGLHEVEALDMLESLNGLMASLAEEGESIGRTGSVLEVVKETHRALNENRPELYSVPRDRLLIAQELLLFENSGSDDLEDLVDNPFRRARFSVKTGWEDGVEKQRFIERVLPRIEAAVGTAGDVQLTGAVAMIARTASASSESLIQSYALALLLITPLMVLLIGSLRAGLVSMVPNLVPILAALALMVLVGVELDMFTILGACIAIGLAVDDSIHFINGFRRNLAETGDPVQAVERTMESTGRALLFTSIVLVAGFVVLGLSSMSNLGNLGLTTAFAIGLAFVLDVTVTPALLFLTHRK